MYEFITEKTLAEYEAFVQSHPKGNFAQSYLWGKQKPMWKWDAIVVRLGRKRCDVYNREITTDITRYMDIAMKILKGK